MTRPITAADLWDLARVGQPEPGPDGSFAVVAVTTYPDDGEGITRLHRVDLDGATTALTSASVSSTAPAISADGGRLAFLRKAGDADEPQLHVMPLDGGEPECLTDLPLGVTGVKWLPDGSGVVAVVPLLRGFASIDATTVERERRGDDPAARA